MALSFQDKTIASKKKDGYTVVKIIKLSANGYPDLLCMKSNCIDEWIECKEENDTLKPLQKFRIDELRALGKIAYCLQDKKGIIY